MEILAELPLVSVIIPAYNAAESLARCLSCLERQTYPAARYEIIVVDNGSSPPLKPVVEKFADVIYQVETSAGSYAARNRGLERARGEIFAFTDADCLPAPDWIENGVRALRDNPDCGLVGGRIALSFRDPRAPLVWEAVDWLYMGFRQPVYLSQNYFAVTANAFTWRRVVAQVGGFEAALKSGGDVEWGQRVHAANYALIYAKNSVVGHAARATRGETLRKVRRLQGGHLAQERRHISQRRLVARCLLRLMRAPRSFTLERPKLALLDSLRTPGGTQIRFSRRFKRRVVLARWAMLAAAHVEALRLLLGGESRRE